MTLFEIRTPDGRAIRQKHESIDKLKAALLPGYVATGIVIGAAADYSGGWVDPIEGPSIMKQLLDAHGDDLLVWLRSRGIEKANA